LISIAATLDIPIRHNEVLDLFEKVLKRVDKSQSGSLWIVLLSYCIDNYHSIEFDKVFSYFEVYLCSRIDSNRFVPSFELDEWMNEWMIDWLLLVYSFSNFRERWNLIAIHWKEWKKRSSQKPSLLFPIHNTFNNSTSGTYYWCSQYLIFLFKWIVVYKWNTCVCCDGGSILLLGICSALELKPWTLSLVERCIDYEMSRGDVGQSHVRNLFEIAVNSEYGSTSPRKSLHSHNR
jgi:hypothetical protein